MARIIKTTEKEYKQQQGKEPEEQPERFQAITPKETAMALPPFVTVFRMKLQWERMSEEPVLSESESCMECQYQCP